MAKYTQQFNNSCGAVALMCAAIELGVSKIPENLALCPLWMIDHDIELPNGDKKSEILIYAVTSGGNGAPSDASGYSLPSNIAKAANALGLNSTAYVPNSILGSLLLYLYGSEQINAQQQGMALNRQAAPTITENQFLLKILRVGDAASWKPATGLHYVMQRDDLSIMDPAIGQNFPSLEMAIEAHNANGTFYQDTGIAVLITN